MSCRNKMSWLLWTLTLIQKLWFWLQYKRKILLLFAKILMFWYSITFLIYDSAEPKQTRQKLFGKLIKETLMDVSSSIRAYRAKNLLAPPMHSILFTTVNCLHIFRKTTVWNHFSVLTMFENQQKCLIQKFFPFWVNNSTHKLCLHLWIFTQNAKNSLVRKWYFFEFFQTLCFLGIIEVSVWS